MNFDRTQQELLNYCKENKILKFFLPIAEVLLVGCVIATILWNFISFGVFTTIIAVLRYLAIVLVLAKGSYFILSLAFAGMALNEIINVIQALFGRTMRLDASSLIWLLVYALLAFIAFKKTGMSGQDLKKTNFDTIKKSMKLDEAKTFDVKGLANETKNSAKSTMNDMKSTYKEATQKDETNNENKGE